jgi:hypothetical protein
MEKIIKNNLRSLEEFQRAEVILKRCRNCLESIDIALRAASQDATPIGDNNNWGSLGDTEDKLHQLLIENGDKS